MSSCVESQFERRCHHSGASYISLLMYSRYRGCLLVEQQLPSILSDHRPTISTLSPVQPEQSFAFFSRKHINHDAPATSLHLSFGVRHPHWEHSRLSPCQLKQRCSAAAGISLPSYYQHHARGLVRFRSRSPGHQSLVPHPWGLLRWPRNIRYVNIPERTCISCTAPPL